MIYVVTLLLAGISMLYEFALAQFIALFFGSTFEIYSVTIGLFTFSLGVGALYYDKFCADKPQERLLLSTEVFISLTAILSPFLLVLLSSNHALNILGAAAKPLAFLPVFLCGWFSGIELPCLLSLGTKENHGEVLFVDFAGMFIGALLFPLFLIDNFGPLKILWLLSMLNILTVVVFLKHTKIKFGHTFSFLCLSALIGLSLLILNESKIILFFQRVHGV